MSIMQNILLKKSKIQKTHRAAIRRCWQQETKASSDKMTAAGDEVRDTSRAGMDFGLEGGESASSKITPATSEGGCGEKWWWYELGKMTMPVG